MLKKMLAFFMCGTLAVTVPGVVSAEDNANVIKVTTTKQTMSMEFLDGLGKLPSFIKETTEPITRAQFTAMIVDLAGVHRDESVPDFADVDSNHDYYTQIQQARAAGLVGGGDDNTFSPDIPIDFDAACKISTAVLGYDYFAGRNGGYPSGYIKAADEAKVMDGSMFRNGYLFAENAALIGYNLLHAKPFEWDKYDTHPILEGMMGLSGFEGVLEYASNESIAETPVAKDFISVDGFSYKLSDALSDLDLTSYIGTKVEYWVDDDSVVVGLARLPQNEEVTINAESAEVSFDGTTLTVYDDGAKKEKYRISSTCQTAYNGRSASVFEEDEADFAGRIRLTDNNHDGRYDSIMVYECEYMLVGAVNLVDNIVIDKNNELKIEIKDDTDYTIYAYDATGEGSYVDWEAIANNQLLEVYSSKDGSYVNIVATTMQFECIVQGMIDNKLMLSGGEYRTTSYYDKYYADKVHPGMSLKVVLAANGRVGAVVEADVTTPVYGYLLKAYVDTDDETMKVMIMDVLGDQITYTLADKFTLDGARAIPTGDDVKKALFAYDEDGTKYCKYQVIRYIVNGDGEVSLIDTASTDYVIESASDEEGFTYPLDRFIKTTDNTNDSLTQMISKKNVVYSNSGIAMPYFPLGSAIIFSVPDALSSDPYGDYDMSDFGLFGSMEHERGYMVDAFDYNSSFAPAVVVVYNADRGNTSTESSAMMVSEVINAVNNDNEVTKRITLYDGATYSNYFVSTSKLDALIAKGNIPRKGDVVRVGINTDSEIVAISIDFTFDPVTRTLKRGGEVAANLSARNSYASGKVYNNDAGTVLLYSPGTSFSFSTSNSVGVSSPVHGLYALRITASNIIMYDTQTNTVRSAKVSEIKNMINSGDDASVIAMRYRSTQNQAVFLFN